MVNVYVQQALLSRVGKLLGYPPVTFGGVTLADKDAWLYAVARATPAERAAWIVSLAPALLAATEAGRARLARASVSDLSGAPVLYGDAFAEPIVAAALAYLPAVARCTLVAEVAFLAVGVDSRAWTSSARFEETSGVRRETVIVLGPTVDVLLVLHELSHAWHSEPRSAASFPAISAAGERGLRELAEAAGFADRLARSETVAETLADATALSWLFAGTGTPGERAA